MATFRFVIADVFTDRPLTGNQLAVFTDAREIPADKLQPLAKEMGFSESVFVYPPESGGHARLRIFTPSNELPFAGHPVLGSAFVRGSRSSATTSGRGTCSSSSVARTRSRASRRTSARSPVSPTCVSIALP